MTNRIQKATIYKCVNVVKERKNPCNIFYVIDILEKETKRKIIFDQEPYIRIITDKEIKEEQIIELFNFCNNQI